MATDADVVVLRSESGAMSASWSCILSAASFCATSSCSSCERARALGVARGLQLLREASVNDCRSPRCPDCRAKRGRSHAVTPTRACIARLTSDDGESSNSGPMPSAEPQTQNAFTMKRAHAAPVASKLIGAHATGGRISRGFAN